MEEGEEKEQVMFGLTIGFNRAVVETFVLANALAFHLVFMLPLGHLSLSFFRRLFHFCDREHHRKSKHRDGAEDGAEDAEFSLYCGWGVRGPGSILILKSAFIFFCVAFFEVPIFL